MSKYAEPAKTTRAKNTTKMSGTTNKLLWLKKNQQTGKITEWKQGSHVLHFQCLTNTWSGGKGGQKTKTRCNQQPSNVPNTNKTKMHVQNAVKHVKQHENKHKKNTAWIYTIYLKCFAGTISLSRSLHATGAIFAPKAATNTQDVFLAKQENAHPGV